MSTTMVGRRRKIEKTLNQNLNQNLNESKSHNLDFFLKKILFRAYNVFIFAQTFQWTSSEFFLISDFLAESLKANKK